MWIWRGPLHPISSASLVPWNHYIVILSTKILLVKNQLRQSWVTVKNDKEKLLIMWIWRGPRRPISTASLVAWDHFFGILSTKPLFVSHFFTFFKGSAHFGALTQCSVHPKAPVLLTKKDRCFGKQNWRCGMI